MRNATPRAFAPIPELATDAEISGLFRMLEQERSADAASAQSDLQRAFGRMARAVAAKLNR